MNYKMTIKQNKKFRIFNLSIYGLKLLTQIRKLSTQNTKLLT
jgi:hypothetical protein